MSTGKSVFEKLIDPINKDNFFSDYWEKDFLYIPRNDGSYYKEILTLEQMNDFLDRNDIRFPTIRMAKDGREVPLADYSNIISFGSYAAEGLINIDKLFNCYYGGATIVHQLMKYSVGSLAVFTNELEKHFGFNVETTVYLTPEQSQGFTAHYDTHSVLVLQVYGSKTWRLYDVVKDLPTLEQTFVKADYIDSEPKKTIKLMPGDLLYVPRGLAHDAITTDGVSLHITLGIFPPLYLDLFKKGIQNAKQDIRFRGAPIDYLLGGENMLGEQFKELLGDFVSGLNEQKLVEQLREVVDTRQMKSSRNRLNDYIHLEEISENSILKKRKNVSPVLIFSETTVMLKMYNKQVECPAEFREVLTFILDVDEFAVKDVEGVAGTARLSLLRKLISEGLLEILRL